MIRLALALLFAASICAQVVSIPTGCDRFNGSPVVTVTNTNFPPVGAEGGWDGFEVRGLRDGDMAALFIGDSNATQTVSGLQLPFDLGLLYPTLSGCCIMTSMEVSMLSVAQPVSTGCCIDYRARFWVYFPPLLPINSFSIQAFVPDDGPVGWVWSNNALEYFLD